MHKSLYHWVIAILSFLPFLAAAGAWNSGSFDNDDALDWVTDCTRTTGANAISSALKDAIKSKYLEAPEASYAIAAAEVVAAARGKPNPSLPKPLASWLQRQSQAEIAALAPTAIMAVSRIVSERDSELQELWKESKEYRFWLQHMHDLRARLR